VFRDPKGRSRRILDRRLARELTREQLKSVAGGDGFSVVYTEENTFTPDDDIDVRQDIIILPIIH